MPSDTSPSTLKSANGVAPPQIRVQSTVPSVASAPSVCVDASWRRRGVGKRIVEAQIARLRALHVGQIVVLTYATEFFAGLGFREIDKHAIMYKLYTGCMNCPKHDDPFTCPEHAMALQILGGDEKSA